MINTRPVCFPMGIGWALAAMAAAIMAPAPAFALDQAGRISQSVSERFRNQQQETLRPITRAPKGPVAEEAAPEGLPKDKTCFQIRTIAVEGNQSLSDAQVKGAVAGFRGQCLGLAGMNEVLKALTFLYVKHGYVASRAFLPEQDLASGTLSVKIVEGKLEKIVEKGAGGNPGNLKTAFPGLTGKPVRLPVIEQGLDQINRLSSRKAKIDLQAGKERGDSVLAVAIERSRPWSASYSADNYGSAATGLYESKLTFGYDDLFGLNDQFQLSWQRSMERNPLYVQSDDRNSNSVSLSATIPYGLYTFGLDGSWSGYQSSVAGQIGSLDTDGYSLSVAPFVTYMLDRDQQSKTWVTGRLTWKSTDNFLLGSHIDASSRILTIASVGLGHSHTVLGGELEANIGIERGLSIFGAVDDRFADAGSPKAQFTKETASLSYTKSADLGALTGIFSTRLSGQRSDDPLFASEQMSLGGVSSVRGSREAVFSGSDAILLRTELSVLLPKSDTPVLGEAFGQLEPYAAIDWGRAFANEEDGSLAGSATGVSLGLRNRGGRLNFDISWSRIIATDPGSAGADLPGGLVLARLGTTF